VNLASSFCVPRLAEQAEREPNACQSPKVRTIIPEGYGLRARQSWLPRGHATARIETAITPLSKRS
jgi:hypothetical protein